MSNDLTQNPWIIDTAASTTISTDNNLKLNYVRWVNATTSGHQCVIQNEDGMVIWESYANAANYVERDQLKRTINGMIVPTLDSGKLYIYFGF